MSEAKEKIVSSLRIKVFNVGNRGSTLRYFKAKAGKGWNDDGIDEMLDSIATDLETRFPNEEFKLVEIGSNGFNFVHVGAKDGASKVGV